MVDDITMDAPRTKGFVGKLGELNVDLPSLHTLAAAGDGVVIHVPER